MKTRLAILLVLGGCALGAYHRFKPTTGRLRKLLAAPTSFPVESRAGIREIQPDSNLGKFCQAGRVTVFVFCSPDSASCKRLRKHLTGFAALRRDVAIRLVDVGKDWTEIHCRTKYGIKVHSVPHVLIYDANGVELAVDVGTRKTGLDLLHDWMSAERKRDTERRAG